MIFNVFQDQWLFKRKFKVLVIYIEGKYIMCDKFSSTCKQDLYLYPVLFPDMYDLYAIHEGGDCGVKK